MGLFAMTRGHAGAAAISNDCTVTDLEARIARRDFRGITKDMLPTPCMIVDLDMFKANIKHMANTARRTILM
jgi:hypothetical protein